MQSSRRLPLDFKYNHSLSTVPIADPFVPSDYAVPTIDETIDRKGDAYMTRRLVARFLKKKYYRSLRFLRRTQFENILNRCVIETYIRDVSFPFETVDYRYVHWRGAAKEGQLKKLALDQPTNRNG